jgi:hypothetical protein
MLRGRKVAQKRPTTCWVFQRPTQRGHLPENSYKVWISKALKTLPTAHEKDPNTLEVEPFEPYCLRHTFMAWVVPHLGVLGLARRQGTNRFLTLSVTFIPLRRTSKTGWLEWPRKKGKVRPDRLRSDLESARLHYMVPAGVRDVL